MDGRVATGWIARPVLEPTTVETVRDHLYGWLGAPEPYRRATAPHVSVFGVRVPAAEAEAVEADFDAFAESVGTWRGSLSGYHVHPSARNPMVVALDVPLDVERLASPIADLLARHGGRVGRGPHPAHATLLKGGVRGEELQWAQVDDRTRERLAAVLEDGRQRERYDPPDPLVAPTFGVELGPPELAWN